MVFDKSGADAGGGETCLQSLLRARTSVCARTVGTTTTQHDLELVEKFSSSPLFRPICISDDEGRRRPECDAAELPPTGDAWDQVLCVAVVLALAMLVFAGIRGSLFRPLILEAENYRWARLIVRPSMLWGTMGIALLAFRTILWFRYRSSPSATMADAPSLTLIIPAYNEGGMVLRSIESVARARYPR